MRLIKLIILSIFLAQYAFSQTVKVNIGSNGVLFSQKEDTILFYQTVDKRLDDQRKVSNYIHPLYSLDGQILTEEFPPDHPHQRGIFWAWHQLYVGDERIGDGWEVTDIKWEVVSIVEVEREGIERGIQSYVVWKSPLWLDKNGNEKQLVSENTTITVYPASKNYRKVDIEISLLAREPDMRIGGSQDEKGYGGFSSRIKLPDDVVFTSSTGRVEPQLLPVETGGWMDITGSLDLNDSRVGLTILCHPQNPGYPHPWILRAKESMQNAVYPYPGARPVTLSSTEPTVLRYRLLIHNGIAPSAIESLHAEYGQE